MAPSPLQAPGYAHEPPLQAGKNANEDVRESYAFGSVPYSLTPGTLVWACWPAYYTADIDRYGRHVRTSIDRRSPLKSTTVRIYAGVILGDQLFTNSPNLCKARAKASGGAVAKPKRK